MTNGWTVGYVANIGYTYSYCAELNPLRALGAAARRLCVPRHF